MKNIFVGLHALKHLLANDDSASVHVNLSTVHFASECKLSWQKAADALTSHGHTTTRRRMPAQLKGQKQGTKNTSQQSKRLTDGVSSRSVFYYKHGLK